MCPFWDLNGWRERVRDRFSVPAPCLQCTKSLLQAGITQINYLRNYHNDEYAMRLITLKGVKLHQIKLDANILDEVNLDQYIHLKD